MLDDIVKYFGNQSALSKALGVTSSNLSTWLQTNKIPSKHLIEIERLTCGEFKALEIQDYLRNIRILNECDRKK